MRFKNEVDYYPQNFLFLSKNPKKDKLHHIYKFQYEYSKFVAQNIYILTRFTVNRLHPILLRFDCQNDSMINYASCQMTSKQTYF